MTRVGHYYNSPFHGVRPVRSQRAKGIPPLLCVHSNFYNFGQSGKKCPCFRLQSGCLILVLRAMQFCSYFTSRWCKRFKKCKERFKTSHIIHLFSHLFNFISVILQNTTHYININKQKPL